MYPKDDAILNFRKLLDFSQASEHNYQSVKNWVEGTKPLVLSESQLFCRDFKSRDTISLRKATGKHNTMQWFTNIAKFVHPRLLSKVCPYLQASLQTSVDFGSFQIISSKVSQLFFPALGFASVRSQ